MPTVFTVPFLVAVERAVAFFLEGFKEGGWDRESEKETAPGLDAGDRESCWRENRDGPEVDVGRAGEEKEVVAGACVWR